MREMLIKYMQTGMSREEILFLYVLWIYESYVHKRMDLAQRTHQVLQSCKWQKKRHGRQQENKAVCGQKARLSHEEREKKAGIDGPGMTGHGAWVAYAQWGEIQGEREAL